MATAVPPTNRTREEVIANNSSDDNGDSDNYEALHMVGTGAHGSVYKARDIRDRSGFVALKRIKMKLTGEGVPLTALREIAVLKQLDKFEHPNIVRYSL